MSADFRRKNIRWPAANYRGKGFYFVTLCFYSRHRLGTNPGIARWLIAMLRKHAAHHNFHVHAYCVMPDHMHILANAATDSSDLMGFVESFKQETAVVFGRRCDRRLWQFKYFDRILRATDLPEQVAWYIWLNPEMPLFQSWPISLRGLLHRSRFKNVKRRRKSALDTAVEAHHAEVLM